jgi:uncharacterized protein (TIGR02246 family)
MITYILALTLLAAAQPTSTPSAADIALAHKAEVQKAINAGNAAYISTWQHGYAHSFAMLYTEDAASINGDGTITRGRANIEAARIAEFRTESLLRGTISTEDLVVEDDLAYEMGNYSFTLKAPDKPETVEVGRYLTIWQRQPDGKWLIKTDAGLTNRNCSQVM